MDEKSVPDLLSQMVPDPTQANPDQEQESAGDQNTIELESLKAAAGLSGGPLETALSEFLSGKGILHDATRAAITADKSTSVNVVANYLIKQFNLSPAIAGLIAPLLVKLLPSVAKGAKKPRRKPKTETSKTKKKPKKKTATKPAPKKKPARKPKKTSTTKTETGKTKRKPKKKTAPKSGKKGTAKKPKKRTRTTSVENL